MQRATWKFPFTISTYLDKSIINLFNVSRSTIIPESLYKKKVTIYNGQFFLPLIIKNSMLGRKFGEFSITKVLGSNIIRKKKKNKKKKK